jgi:hypothetical protein
MTRTAAGGPTLALQFEISVDAGDVIPNRGNSCQFDLCICRAEKHSEEVDAPNASADCKQAESVDHVHDDWGFFVELDHAHDLAQFVVPEVDAGTVVMSDGDQVVVYADFHKIHLLAVEVVLQLPQHAAVRSTMDKNF